LKDTEKTKVYRVTEQLRKTSSSKEMTGKTNLIKNKNVTVQLVFMAKYSSLTALMA
jgi:hypothetical protein